MRELHIKQVLNSVSANESQPGNSTPSSTHESTVFPPTTCPPALTTCHPPLAMQRNDPLNSPFVPFSPNPSIQQGTPSATPPLKHTLTTTASSNLRYSSSRKSIYDRHLDRTRRSELSKASFAFLFGEMVQYAQKRVNGIADLEKKYLPLPFR